MTKGREFEGLMTLGGGLALLGLSFTTDGAGAVSVTNTAGAPAVVTKSAGTGIYRITLGKTASKVDKYYKLLACVPSIGKSTVYGYGIEWKAEDVDGTTPYIDLQVRSGAGGATGAATATNNNESAHTHAITAGTPAIAAVTLCGHMGYLNPDAADLVSVVNDVLLADGVLAIALQPDYPRKLQVRITDADSSISAGTVTLVGREVDGTAITQVINLAGGTRTVVTTKAFATLTSATVAALAGHGVGDNIGIGMGLSLGCPAPAGCGSFQVIKACVDTANEAVGTVDATARTIEPTTAANATHDYDFFYSYTVTPTQAAHDHGAATAAGSAHTHTQAAHTHTATATAAADPLSARIDVLLLLQTSEVD